MYHISPIAISLGSYVDKAAGRRACTGKIFTQDVSVVSRSCLGVVLVLFCCFFGGVLGIFQWCVGDVSGMFRWSLRNDDYDDDEWVMASCCVVDVAVLFYFFGDGVLIFWWTLMNILIGFPSKISNSNLNLYIVHLWANQCSCGSYVVGWCFKCFDVLVTSRACFGEISVMCVDGAVMFMMMSGWWLGVVSLMLQCCFFSLAWCFDCLVMNIDEHFDRVSKQNLKFQFEFVYCAPLGKPV